MQNKPSKSIKSLLSEDNIKKRFKELLGSRSQGFITSLLSIVGNNELLSNADPKTILSAAATAATLDLPINPNLGFAWVVPYRGNAQFQIGWKGLVQLALRTGQYVNINVIIIHENQFTSFNELTEELKVDMTIEGNGNIVGYAAYFKLKTGFTKTSYWSKEKCIKHGRKYSKSYDKGNWSKDFDSMALKTVLKNTLSKWGVLSIEMETAQLADQSVQPKEGVYDYPDNEKEIIDITDISNKKEIARVAESIAKAENVKQLQDIENALIDQENYPESIKELIEEKKTKLIDKQFEIDQR